MPNNNFDYKLPQLVELRQQMYNQILGIQVFLANVDINDLPSDYDKVVNLYELLKKDYKELCVSINKLQEHQNDFNNNESLVVKVADDLKPKIDYGAVALSNEMAKFHSEKSKKNNGDFNPMLAAMY